MVPTKTMVKSTSALGPYRGTSLTTQDQCKNELARLKLGEILFWTDLVEKICRIEMRLIRIKPTKKSILTGSTDINWWKFIGNR